MFRLLILLPLFAIVRVQAQYIVTEVPKLEVGVLAGVNRTLGYDNHDIVFTSRKTGLSTGINFIYNFSPKVGLNTSLLYENRGWKDVSSLFGPVDTVMYESKISASYLSMPLLGKLQLGEARIFMIEAGIQPSLRIGKQHWNESEGLSADLSDQFNVLDLGAVVGFGSKFALKDKGNLYLKVRQHFGLNRIDQIDGWDVSLRSYQILFGWTTYLCKSE